MKQLTKSSLQKLNSEPWWKDMLLYRAHEVWHDQHPMGSKSIPVWQDIVLRFGPEELIISRHHAGFYVNMIFKFPDAEVQNIKHVKPWQRKA